MHKPWENTMRDQNEDNKIMVRDFYHTSLNLARPEDAVRKYLGPYYRQHNPGAGDGAEAFIAFVKGFTSAFPRLHFDFKRLIAEGDLVVVHSHLVRQPGDRGMAVMDIFRIENDKIVEHWDVLQEIPATPANTNTMF
jgi:predicted SnoaL-like aldol condensation-catalyzing enzyme